jgi:AcrR family transcriptional regulator
LAQRKKAEVREAILKSAFRLFSKKGYTGATVPQIAAGARCSVANVYVYFRSKLEIVFAIYDPWLRAQLESLEEAAEAIADPEQRLRHIVTALWRDIPAANHGFTTNIMQAIAAGTPDEGYESGLIRWAEAKVAAMLDRTLSTAGAPAQDPAALAHIVFMAFDGFSINYHINPWAACSEAIVESFCAALLRGARPRRRLQARAVGGPVS